ncbi:MAG: hypothetical protein GXP62_11730 [Oligoflexia bacterium]|nr:hypothetical protein [Oligoflexia bacterium]
MFITVTANPMVEHLFPVADPTGAHRHRPAQAWSFATGKGLNVARALKDLGEDVVAVLAVGGRRGREIVERVEGEGIRSRIVAVRGENRAGSTLFHQGEHTTIYGPGPVLEDGDVEALVASVRALLPARCIVLAGSVNHKTLYPRLASLGAPLALDFCHPCLDECMKLGNVLIAKPNLRELGYLYGVSDPVVGAHRLHDQGARWSVVTDGPSQAIFQSGGVVRCVEPVPVRAVHPVGCGDALLAGLLHALPRGPQRAVAFAMACGAHNAARPEIASLDPAACEALARQVKMSRLES